MRHKKKIYAILVFVFLTIPVISQETVTITEEKKTTLQLPKDYSKTLGLYIFPTKNQDSIQREKDFKECYKWAYEQTKFDPLNPTKVGVKQVEKEKGSKGCGHVDGTPSRRVQPLVAEGRGSV